MSDASIAKITALVSFLSILPTQLAWADSLRLRWEVNGHDYQAFDSPVFTWAEAKISCETKGGYLATLTSEEERFFVAANIQDYGYIGGRKPTGLDVWSWITGEKFQYTYWASGQPGSDAGVVYMSWGTWINDPGVDPGNYICEFAPNAYLDVTGLPDINGNGSPELASLFISTTDQKINIDVKDSVSKARIKLIKFLNPSTLPPISVAPVADLSGDGVADIAVLFSGMPSNAPFVNIYDSLTGRFVKTINYLNNTSKPIGLRDMPDANANGVGELTVLGVNVNTDKATAQTRDPATGALISSISY